MVHETAISKKAETQLLPVNGTTPLMGAIHLAMEKGVGVDVLAKLLEMQERWEANQARKAFEEAFAAFKSGAPKLEKTKEVSFGGKGAAYKYTPLDVIANALGPQLANHGLSYNWKQESNKESITVTCILRHVDGHSIENTLSAGADPSGSKNSIQAIGSTVSYLRRYTLLGVLGMATSDEDTDGITMGNAVDFVANMEAASDMDELARAYKEAVQAALKASDSKAVKIFMEAKNRRAAELAKRGRNPGE